MRGHCIFWGVDKFVPPWQRVLPRDELENAMRERIRRVMKDYGDGMTDFDVNNEMMHGDFYTRKLGLRTGAAFFKWCKALNPKAVLCVNEYNISAATEVDRYVEHIKQLVADGADLGGIGDQGQFHSGVPKNARVWAVFDKLGQFKVPVTITEFSLFTTDERLQAADLRRFYRLCFAHPAIQGIYMWGFWEGQIYRPESALWRQNWSLKPAGKEYVKLVTEEWITRGDAATDANGVLKFRGFYGDYVLAVGGKRYRVSFRPGATEAAAAMLP